MSGARLYATLTLILGLAAPLGCCERKGYIVRCDMALELNRVSHLLGRHVGGGAGGSQQRQIVKKQAETGEYVEKNPRAR